MQPHTTPKLIIFDWDGTLADTTAAIITTMQACFTEAGLTPPIAQDIQTLIGYSLPAMVQQLAPEADIATQQKLVHAYMHHQLNPNSQTNLFFPDIRACLDALKQAGYWLAVATGKGRIGLDKSIAASQTANDWLATRCASECASKPAPDMVWQICDELGISPNEAIVVGDTTHDLDMAANAGAYAIGITTGAHSEEALKSRPHLAIIHHLSELPPFLTSHFSAPES